MVKYLGTHNSGTSSKLVWWQRPFGYLLNLTSRCQTLSIEDQLKNNVRLFNLQVTFYKNECVFSHGLCIYTGKLLDAIESMKQYATKESPVYFQLFLDKNFLLGQNKEAFKKLVCDLIDDLRDTNVYMIYAYIEESDEYPHRNGNIKINMSEHYWTANWAKVNAKSWIDKLPLPKRHAKIYNDKYMEENKADYLMLDFIEIGKHFVEIGNLFISAGNKTSTTSKKPVTTTTSSSSTTSSTTSYRPYFTWPPVSFKSMSGRRISGVNIYMEGSRESRHITALPTTTSFTYDTFLDDEKITIKCTSGNLYYRNNANKNLTLVNDKKFSINELYGLVIVWDDTVTTTTSHPWRITLDPTTTWYPTTTTSKYPINATTCRPTTTTSWFPTLTTTEAGRLEMVNGNKKYLFKNGLNFSVTVNVGESKTIMFDNVNGYPVPNNITVTSNNSNIALSSLSTLYRNITISGVKVGKTKIYITTTYKDAYYEGYINVTVKAVTTTSKKTVTTTKMPTTTTFRPTTTTTFIIYDGNSSAGNGNPRTTTTSSKYPVSTTTWKPTTTTSLYFT